ncbi:hypothetical protein D9599_15520 [Roseomonas sp. KE2513]|uniref:hypothetical protein n=1 Tax=Roseomonas sp. KE2513 TaxID=2479202 RepID=UPI0018DF37ED|nr:hypothetical protein [Roseomonas sp. KE2513]MBI0536979.1 hypothetical protein [Roseomonas sp. KE2513]
MSRHELPARQPRTEVTVGWDAPMQTFFAQVENLDAPDDADPLLLWISLEQREIAEPEAMILPLAPYADLTVDHLAELRRDRDDSNPWEA